MPVSVPELKVGGEEYTLLSLIFPTALVCGLNAHFLWGGTVRPAEPSCSGVNCCRLKLLAPAQLPSSAGAELLSFAQEERQASSLLR